MLSFLEQKTRFEQIYPRPAGGVKLTLTGADGYTVYNPSIPFNYEGRRYIFGRVEKLELWADSRTFLFAEKDGVWHKCERFAELPLEDPFIAFYKGEIVLGGVKVEKKDGIIVNYYCKFYRGRDLFNLEFFTRGPDNMKDVRLAELRDGRLGVCTRPRSEEIRQLYGSESMMGFTVLDSLDMLNAEVIIAAKLIEGVFGKDEWGGPNQLYVLDNGYIGIVGHQGYMDRTLGYDKAIYASTAYVFCPVKFAIIESKVLATRACFPDGGTKRKGTADIVFSAGATKENGRTFLYVGLNDCEIGCIEIDDPFIQYGGIKPHELYG